MGSDQRVPLLDQQSPVVVQGNKITPPAAQLVAATHNRAWQLTVERGDDTTERPYARRGHIPFNENLVAADLLAVFLRLFTYLGLPLHRYSSFAPSHVLLTSVHRSGLSELCYITRQSRRRGIHHHCADRHVETVFSIHVNTPIWHAELIRNLRLISHGISRSLMVVMASFTSVSGRLILDIRLRANTEESHGTAPLDWEITVCRLPPLSAVGILGSGHQGRLLAVPTSRYSYPHPNWVQTRSYLR